MGHLTTRTSNWLTINIGSIAITILGFSLGSRSLCNSCCAFELRILSIQRYPFKHYGSLLRLEIGLPTATNRRAEWIRGEIFYYNKHRNQTGRGRWDI